jgi:hypothetical protein
MPARDFRDRLCELEPLNPQLQRRYEEAMKTILEQKLTPAMKGFIVCVGIASVGMAIFLGTLALIHEELPGLARTALAGGGAFAVAWAVLAGWILRKGTWFGRIQPTIIAGLAWMLAVLMETCFLVLAPQFPDRYLGTVAIFSGLVILIGAGVGLLSTRMQQTELTMREALLQLECRVAQLTEELSKHRQQP